MKRVVCIAIALLITLCCTASAEYNAVQTLFCDLNRDTTVDDVENWCKDNNIYYKGEKSYTGDAYDFRISFDKETTEMLHGGNDDVLEIHFEKSGKKFEIQYAEYSIVNKKSSKDYSIAVNVIGSISSAKFGKATPSSQYFAWKNSGTGSDQFKTGYSAQSALDPVLNNKK